MNCQKGDIARVVGADFQRDNGLIVEVVKLAPTHFWDNGPEWECKPCYPCVGSDYHFALGAVSEETVSMKSVDIPDDAWLRPIRPDAEPIDTDVVAEVRV